MNVEALNFRVWDTDRTQRLRQLWWNGERAHVIAVLLGVTPRALRHKIERCGFVRNPLLALMKKQQRIEIGDPKNEPTPILQEDGTPVTMHNVRHSQCQWIAGEPSAEAVMCGHPVARARYCEHHAVRAYVPMR